MNRPFIIAIFIAFSSAALAAQQSGQQNPYQGTSNPPADDAIITDQTTQAAQPTPAKPPAGHPLNPTTVAPQQPALAQDAQAQAIPSQDQNQPQPSPVAANPSNSTDGTDNGIVGVGLGPAMAQSASSPAPVPPTLASRAYSSDPDGDIVHPQPLRPGELPEGTMIRVKLLDRLSTALTERGEAFHSQVASDVLAGGQVIIPAGTEIDGTVVQVSSGHAGGSGSMRLRPQEIILADGTRYHLYADVTGTPGSRTHISGEGNIKPDSRWKRDSIEYGGAVGAGAITGAVMAGPVGALTGGLIGAGAITAHLLVSHPQATLEPGSTLILELTGPLQMSPASNSGN